VHKKEAKGIFLERKVLNPDAFEEVAWRYVHRTMHDLPRMFRIFACKQVFGIAAVNYFVNKRDKTISPKCPCCTIENETTAHILLCREEGRVNALTQLSSGLLHTLNDLGTPRDLTFLIVKYIRERGEISMEQLVRYHNLPPLYIPFAKSQDLIGWCRFLEGMVSTEVVTLVETLGFEEGSFTSVDKWMSVLITQLLEITHGMWIYRNLLIHDPDSGVLAIRRKEALQLEIEKQIALGGEGLAEEDQWMLEINLGDLEESNGEREAYWVVAIEAARNRHRIQRTRDRNAALRRESHQEG
jgi:hypothetical protein